MKIVHSIAILFEPVKTHERYNNLYKNGYIYKWSLWLCFKKSY